MCGGLAMACMHGTPRGSWQAVTAYNGGRLMIYLLLGGISGFFGASINCLGILSGVTHLASLILGTVFCALGSLLLLGFTAHEISLWKKFDSAYSRFSAHFLASTSKLAGQHKTARALILGSMSALLPCGWLYSFVAAAGTEGSPSHAIMVMFIFWLGTLPIMVSIGHISQNTLNQWGIERSRLVAALLLVTGLLTVSGRLGNPFFSNQDPAVPLQCHQSNAER